MNARELRQALGLWEGYRQRDQTAKVVGDAAREWLSFLQGDPKLIWWCESHNAADSYWPPEESLEKEPSGQCMFAVGCDDFQDHGCRIVERILGKP